MQTEPEISRILVVSNDAAFCRELRRGLAGEKDVRIVTEASNATHSLELAREIEPNIVIWDFTSSTGIEREALHGKGKSLGSLRLIAIVNIQDREEVIEAFRLGAHGIVGRALADTRLRECIHKVRTGQHSFDNEAIVVLVSLLRELLPPEKRSKLQADYNLTPRELDIIEKVARGHSNKEVSQAFSISERTVKHYLTGIFEKLGLSSRLELALFAVNHRLALRDSQFPDNESLSRIKGPRQPAPNSITSGAALQLP